MAETTAVVEFVVGHVDQTGQVPELIVIVNWSVKNIHEKSVQEVVWTYEYDGKLFNPLLGFKSSVQEFKKLSPVVHELAARQASLANM